MLVGNLDKMHVRVDIDENDAWRFKPEAPAMAFIRGQPKFKTDLTFEYVESYVIPEGSLTGDSTERVDTRVMQVIYSFKRGSAAHLPRATDGCFHRGPEPTPAPTSRFYKSAGRREKAMRIFFLISVLVACLMAGCSPVGPDYKRVDPPVPAKFGSLEKGISTTESIQTGSLASWWTIFNDSILDSLMKRAEEGSLDLRIAEARVRQARA